MEILFNVYLSSLYLTSLLNIPDHLKHGQLTFNLANLVKAIKGIPTLAWLAANG